MMNRLHRFQPVGRGGFTPWLIAAVGVLATLFLTYFSASGLTYKNIETDYQKTYSHYAPAGKHSDTETYAWDPSLGSTDVERLTANLSKRHANCDDCHDPHSATRASSPLGSYFGAGTQANVSGVRPVYGLTAGTVPQFAFEASVVKEYELCFKCHSSYAFNYDLYQATYGHPMAFNWTKRRYWQPGDPGTDDIINETDTAKEFNPNNVSYHPVLKQGPIPGNKTLTWANGIYFDETFVPGMGAGSYIKCSDCHTSDTNNAKGPHGSNQRYILAARAPTQEPTITRSITLGAIRPTNGGGRSAAAMVWYIRTTELLCYKCHSVDYYGPGKGHPSHGKHSTNCTWHRPIALDEVGCATCKATPIHGSVATPYLMIFNNGSWCYNCHPFRAGARGSDYMGGEPSCPRFYSVASDGTTVEETRVHFQSSRLKAGAEYDVPLPTPDMPNLKGLGNIPAYRYYNRDDDYVLFKKGTPVIDAKANTYSVTFNQPSSGDRPDGQPVGEVGYEDQISLWTVDHAKDSQVYVSVEGNVTAVKPTDVVTPKTATDNLGNDVTDVIARRTLSTEDRSGWFTGTVGYGNTIDEIYKSGNSFVMDFGDLSSAKTVKLLWGVNEEKGGKLPIYVQTKNAKGQWVTRGSARHSEDRFGYLDLTGLFPKGTRHFQVKIIPTLNSIDYMAIATKDSPVKVNKLPIKQATYTKYQGETTDVTALLNARDNQYVTYDYRDTSNLLFTIPAKDKTLTRRDFLFAPVGYYETGGDINPKATLDPMTAEKAQDFATVTPAGGYANHYNIGLIDPGAWNETWDSRLVK